MPDNGRLDNEFRLRILRAWNRYGERRGRKLTQMELAKVVGKLRGEPVSQSTISDWLNKIVPSVRDTLYLAQALQCDPGWLAYGEDSGAPGLDQTAGYRPMPRTRRS